ncbi:MAG: hypothetical protein ASARMPREDX12_008998 [Alectoria sarmentosa]|nr:MAG: hypothetical protein ASARMPREDX12_008998 [Alectoria sarmentosa]
MDDLLDNFATNRLDSPPEETYKYHFVEDSPPASEHAMLVRPETPATLNHDDKLITSEDEDEGDYNADVDEDDDESDDAQDELNGFAQHLQRLHRQDMERDELLTQLHQENRDLKRALKKSTPGGNPRAEAAERSLFQIRKTMIHQDLLQLGKRGGAEAADRMRAEVSNYLQQFGDADAGEWKIMVHLYIDVEGLLARCAKNDIRLKDGEMRDFMLGFTQAQPLFMIVDVGHDSERSSRKVEETFHLFANNVQCKHVIFGCCHDVAYAAALESYAFNPIAASKITLLESSYEDNSYFGSLPFNSVEFSHVFRSTPYERTDLLVGDGDYMQDPSKQSDSNEGDGTLAKRK